MDNLKKKVLNKLKMPYRLFCLWALLLCVCENVPEHCRDGFPAINPSTQFCNQDNQPWDRCGGQTYNTSTHECSGGSIRLKGSGNNTTYTLTVEKNPTAGGTTVPASSQTNITAGTQVTIKATESSGYTFSNWTISGSGTIADPGDASTTVTVNGNVTVTANFTQNPATYTLTVERSPAAGGTTVPASSQTNITAGTQVNISATSASGYSFTNWTVTSGSATFADANNASTSVTVNGNLTIQANFTQNSTNGGDSYESVVIGGKTWMKKNLNIKTASGSWCYNDSDSYCNKYGRLYTWEAATKACPSEWHLPSRDEWGVLAKAAGGTGDYGYGGTAGTALKAKNGWKYNGNGTDNFGFSALPGGYRYTDGGFYGAGDIGRWWTATEGGSGSAYYRNMGYDYDYVGEYYLVRGFGFSVRCVKD